MAAGYRPDPVYNPYYPYITTKGKISDYASEVGGEVGALVGQEEAGEKLGGYAGQVGDAALSAYSGGTSDIVTGESWMGGVTDLTEETADALGLSKYYDKLEGGFEEFKESLSKIGGGGGGDGIKHLPLPPGLQAVVDKGREQQLAQLGVLGDTSLDEDLRNINLQMQRRQKVMQQLAQQPRYAQLRSKELEATSGIGDARRRLRERIAQKGLGSSSVGLAAERSLGRRQRGMFQDIKAQREGLRKERALGERAVDLSALENLRNMRLDNIQRKAGIAGGVLGQPGSQPGIALTQDSGSMLGGLLPLAGAGIGAFLGSGGGPGGTAAGASVGYGIGQSAGSLLDRRRR